MKLPPARRTLAGVDERVALRLHAAHPRSAGPSVGSFVDCETSSVEWVSRLTIDMVGEGDQHPPGFFAERNDDRRTRVLEFGAEPAAVLRCGEGDEFTRCGTRRKRSGRKSCS